MKTGFSNQSSVISGRRAETRSVLECGPDSSGPLLTSDELSTITRSASRRRAEAALWRAAKAEGLAQSKTWRWFVTFLLFVAFPFVINAQSYSIDWYKVAGGGGTSTSGTYQVSGTIGQPDASGVMTGGNYSLAGGFWALISVVQTPGLPNLTITFVGPNSVVVSWPNTGSYTLQTNNNLNVSNWLGYGGTINTVNGTNSITVTPPTGNLFFRLRNP